MKSHRLILVIAGAISTALIAAASAMAPLAQMPWAEAMASLLGTYVLGLGLGWLVWHRGA